MPPRASTSTRRAESVASFAKSGGKSSKASAEQALLVEKKAQLNTATRSREQSPVYTKDQIAEAEGRSELQPEDKKYDTLWRDVQKQMGMPRNKPIHSEKMNRIEHILRVFDLDPSYGPCLGMTRLERWHRAEKLGDEPPREIKEILETRQGVLQYRFSVLHDKGV